MLKWTEYKRVIGAPELLFVAGRTLRRQGVKYTSIAALIGLGAILAEIIGNRLGYDFSVNNVRAFLLPAAVALLTFGLGNTLIAFSNLFSSERILMADANAMNLMEDRKKYDLTDHLEVLWDRVFRYEMALRRVAEDSQAAIDKSRFIETAGSSLKNSLPQALERSLTGFNLSLLEDWYDGAFFTPNDNKLNEQFAAHQAIRGIRQIVGIPLSAQIKEAVSGHPDPLWFTLTMRKIGMCVGSLIETMNKKHVPATEPAYFNAQHFLWNHPETDRLILEDFTDKPETILEDVRSSRREMIRRIFSRKRTLAYRQIFRMFGRDLHNALMLRLDYDIEYAAGLLDYHPKDDLAELQDRIGCQLNLHRILQKKITAAREHLRQIDAFLEEHLPEIIRNPKTHRAVRIGFHVNRFQIQKLVPNDIPQAIETIRNKIAASENRYSMRICLLRQHFELTRIQLFSYIRMIDELGDYDSHTKKELESSPRRIRVPR
jgi:hypothetical protein